MRDLILTQTSHKVLDNGWRNSEKENIHQKQKLTWHPSTQERMRKKRWVLHFNVKKKKLLHAHTSTQYTYHIQLICIILLFELQYWSLILAWCDKLITWQKQSCFCTISISPQADGMQLNQQKQVWLVCWNVADKYFLSSPPELCLHFPNSLNGLFTRWKRETLHMSSRTRPATTLY